MPRRRLIDRLIAFFRRDGDSVLVLVNTTRGVRTVSVPVRDLR